MVRYDAAHKQATRERILETSGRRLKADGIDGSGVATLMKDAGLTNGAFYAHFDSKESLVAEVVARELGSQLAALSSLSDGSAGVGEMIASYMTTEHRDAPSLGCPSAAMLDEIARAPEAVRETFSASLMAIVDELVRRLGGPSEPVSAERRATVLSAYALMVGTIQLSRALTDRELSRRVIERGLENVTTILGSGPVTD